MPSPIVLPVAFCFVLAGDTPATRPASLQATVEARVELMSTIFRLAGNPEYNHALPKSPYASEVGAHFGTFRDHPAVQMARKLRQSRGISYDAVMSMAIHLTDTQDLQERVPFDQPNTSLDSRWRPHEAREFIAKARQFVKDSKFNAFIKAHGSVFAQAKERVTEAVRRSRCVEWLDSFFGPRPGATFHISIGMLNGPASYGGRVRYPDGREEIYAIAGMARFDDKGIPVVGSITELLVHEFGHSYTNSLVDKYGEQLEKAGKTLFACRQEEMKRQAYGTWDTMMRESVLRACGIRFALATQGEAAADKAAAYEEGQGFTWAGELAKCLQEYEDHRDRYPTLDAFMPKIVDFFNHYVPKFEARIAKEPKVVKMIPADGAKNVDPTLTEIKVTFDRPMRNGSWAFVGGGPNFPETTGKPSYDKECKVLTLPVRLKPNWEYRFSLNGGKYMAFTSQEGVPLRPVPVTFRTSE